MKKTKISLIFIIIIILITISSCTKQPNNSKLKLNESKQIIHLLEGIEMEIINIMSKVDLVPYYQKQIEEKREKQKNQKEQSGKSADAEKKNGNSGQTTEEKGEGDSGQNTKIKDEKFNPKPITNHDVLLFELLEQEYSFKLEEHDDNEIPDDIIFIWYEINEKIDRFHFKWNDIKLRLKDRGLSQDRIDPFDETLNLLTISSNKNIYFKTLVTANKLTSFIPEFFKYLNDDNLASIYLIKYHTRQIVLHFANNDFINTNKNLELIKSEIKKLKTELVDKKSKELLDKLILSISDLEDAILVKDINLIKIKASIIIKNVRSFII